jgi:hypothetical protein
MAVPMTLFVVFGVAEGIGLEPGWWGHLLQLAAAVALAVGAWVRPRIGGPVLILAGAVFTAMVLLSDRESGAKLASIAIVLVPLIVAGVFFTLADHAGTRARRTGSPSPDGAKRTP